MSELNDAELNYEREKARKEVRRELFSETMKAIKIRETRQEFMGKLMIVAGVYAYRGLDPEAAVESAMSLISAVEAETLKQFPTPEHDDED